MPSAARRLISRLSRPCSDSRGSGGPTWCRGTTSNVRLAKGAPQRPRVPRCVGNGEAVAASARHARRQPEAPGRAPPPETRAQGTRRPVRRSATSAAAALDAPPFHSSWSPAWSLTRIRMRSPKRAWREASSAALQAQRRKRSGARATRASADAVLADDVQRRTRRRRECRERGVSSAVATRAECSARWTRRVPVVLVCGFRKRAPGVRSGGPSASACATLSVSVRVTPSPSGRRLQVQQHLAARSSSTSPGSARRRMRSGRPRPAAVQQGRAGAPVDLRAELHLVTGSISSARRAPRARPIDGTWGRAYSAPSAAATAPASGDAMTGFPRRSPCAQELET